MRENFAVKNTLRRLFCRAYHSTARSVCDTDAIFALNARRKHGHKQGRACKFTDIYDAKIRSVRLEFSAFAAFFAERHAPRMCGEHDVTRAKNVAAIGSA